VHNCSGSSRLSLYRASHLFRAGKKIVESLLGGGRRLSYLTELSPSGLHDFLPALPVSISGADFVASWGGVDDPLSVIAPTTEYPVRAAASFPVEENFRCSVARSLLFGLQHLPSQSAGAEDALAQIGELMVQAHKGYTSIGLGAHATDRIVEEAVKLGRTGGVYGARVSGGGSGGTVVVLCRDEALPALETLAQRLAQEHGVTFTGFIR
jgi:galactokinase